MIVFHDAAYFNPYFLCFVIVEDSDSLLVSYERRIELHRDDDRLLEVSCHIFRQFKHVADKRFLIEYEVCRTEQLLDFDAQLLLRHPCADRKDNFVIDTNLAGPAARNKDGAVGRFDNGSIIAIVMIIVIACAAARRLRLRSLRCRRYGIGELALAPAPTAFTENAYRVPFVRPVTVYAVSVTFACTCSQSAGSTGAADPAYL